MKNIYLLLSLLFSFLFVYQASAQQVLSSAALPAGYTDNQAPSPQTGTEIINTPTGQSVRFVSGGSFEHVGQFYIAANGIYDGSFLGNGSGNGTDYFGYAPVSSGTYNGPYLGSGIMGASPNNGGTRAATPTFGNLFLTSTGNFPVAAGMKIRGQLTFGKSGGSGSSIITVPDGYQVTFISGFPVIGMNEANYINGTAAKNFPQNPDPFLFPVGDPLNINHPYHPLTLNYDAGWSSVSQARYLNSNPLPVSAAYLGGGVGAVSTIGYWNVGAVSQYSHITVSIPQPEGLGNNSNPANIRLVGWTGSKWVLLGDQGAKVPTGGAGSDLNGYTLSGGVPGRSTLVVSAVGVGTIENAPMPVNLVSFTGYYVEGIGTRLNWQTSLETNNDHFEIQRSGDAKSFESIGQVAGKGTILAITNYDFFDAFMPAGTSYYRLKQVDIDGSQHLSSIIAIRYGDDNSPAILTLSPNPTQGPLKVNLSKGQQIGEVSLYDMQGRLLGKPSVSVPDVSLLPSGNYLLKVLTTTGQSLRQRFIKQ